MLLRPLLQLQQRREKWQGMAEGNIPEFLSLGNTSSRIIVQWGLDCFKRWYIPEDTAQTRGGLAISVLPSHVHESDTGIRITPPPPPPIGVCHHLHDTTRFQFYL